VVNDLKAVPVRLTRDRSVASGYFIHEEISDGIFDEINNVIDANRALARGQQHFLLGQLIYYRIYAERQHVIQRVEEAAHPLAKAIADQLQQVHRPARLRPYAGRQGLTRKCYHAARRVALGFER
jgi:hypothetical protein